MYCGGNSDTGLVEQERLDGTNDSNKWKTCQGHIY
jgi:hypothetical protein